MLQAAVGADHDLEVAGLQDVVEAAVIEFQQVVGNLECHFLALAFL